VSPSTCYVDPAPRPQAGARLAAESGDVAEAVRTAFGTDIETLNQEFATYIRNSLTFPAAEMTFAERLPEIEVSRSVEISESEASFYLGDLLSHSDRLTEAEPWLERSLELGGEYEPALSALAALHRREGNSAEASGFLERALEAPDAGYLPHLLAAIDALVERPFEEVADVAEEQLRFVTAERPALPEGHYWLGHLLLRRPGRSEEALAALETAANLSGGEPRMRLAWAQGLAATGNDLQATGMLMGFLQTVTEPAYRARAEELLAELRQLSAAREAAAARAAQPGSPPAAAPPAVPPPDLVRDPAAAPSRRDGIPTPILPEGMAMREGEVNFVGCLGSFQLVLASAGGTLRLAAPDLSNVSLVSYSATVSGEMPCGEIDPPLPARVIYRPSDGSNPEVDGTPVRIDFLP
jgi:tetratricopeptide (TPR) repeat protein